MRVNKIQYSINKDKIQSSVWLRHLAILDLWEFSSAKMSTLQVLKATR